jgi:tRNA uridine 5-carboxymethylaminomethyl modification enzyme
LIRLKTGTPPRIYKDSINFKKMQAEPGTNEKLSFAHFNPHYLAFKKQCLCYLTHTNEKTHKIIKANLSKSAMYSGNIKGVGPRYCPSIEDKVVRFSDKPRHQLFVEPESLYMDTMYLQGLSTSLPEDIQEKFVRTIPGLEKARFQRHAYAIEYDAINPTQLWPTLETKKYKGLFFAGQVNGSSGYEEAAAQGMIAGMNASLLFRNKKPIVLKRDEAYIGVLIDDLVTKGVTDPYRLLTSRAEHRLSLRNDNAQDRLIKYGYYTGTISKTNYKKYQAELKFIENTIAYLKANSINEKLIKKYGQSSHKLYDLLKRPEVKLIELLSKEKYQKLSSDAVNKIEINVKFDGYIKSQSRAVEKYNKLENIDLTPIGDYKMVKNLSLEARDKLNKIRPLTLSQAQRIQGITSPDIIMIKYYIDKLKK